MEIHIISSEDCTFVTTRLRRPIIEDFESHVIIEINSLFNYFELINTEWDHAEDVFLELLELYNWHKLSAV
jgi:hypothetical protein